MKRKLSRDIATGDIFHFSTATECRKHNEMQLAYEHMYWAYQYQCEQNSRLFKIIEENDLESKLLEKGLEY